MGLPTDLASLFQLSEAFIARLINVNDVFLAYLDLVGVSTTLSRVGPSEVELIRR